jgi:uncharacterized protein YjiS (DUF1127 family)
MMQSSASLNESMIAQLGWIVRGMIESGAKAARYFIALMKEDAVHERSRRELASLDPHLLGDIGLEPFDVYYGWRRPSR